MDSVSDVSMNPTKFEKLIKDTATGEDPLAAYVNYHRWLKTNQPNKRKEILDVISRCIRKFRNDARYKQEPRFLRMCVLYAYILDEPLEFFSYLWNRKIGTDLALYYEAKAVLQEKKGKLMEAEETYQLGIKKGAIPITRLKNNYSSFKSRMEKKQPKIVDENKSQNSTISTNSSKNGQKRHQSTNEKEDFQYEELRAVVYRKKQEDIIAKRKEEEKRKQEEIKQKKEEERKRKLEEKKRKEEERKRMEELKKQEELEKERIRKEEELERLRIEELNRKLELEKKKKEEEELERKRKEEIEMKKKEEQKRIQESQIAAAAIDLSALELSDGEDEIEEIEELLQLSFDENTEELEVTELVDADTLIFEGDLTRSGSSMFNIVDKTSNINGTIHTVFHPEKTVTFYTKQAEDYLKDAFNCPLSDSEDDESSEEVSEDEDTHIKGFTGHIPIEDVDDPLAFCTPNDDDDSNNNGFCVYQDSGNDENNIPQKENSSSLGFTIYQDGDDDGTSLKSSSNVFEVDELSEGFSEDIFGLSDMEEPSMDIPVDESEDDEEGFIFTDDELNEKIKSNEPLNPYTHDHARALQLLPVFHKFLQDHKSDETYSKLNSDSPYSQNLQKEPKRMRSTKFQEEEFEEYPLFENDRRSITRKSVLTLGPCVGSGGFAKVFLGHHFFDTDGDNDTMAVEDTRRALKYQKHAQDPWAIRWEFYTMTVLHSRLSSLLREEIKFSFYQLEYMKQRFCSAMYVREFNDSSFLMLSYLDQGTLHDLINAHRVKKRKIDEGLIAFFALEILSIVYCLHKCNIIHGDIKPDNFLFMNENTPGKTWDEWNIDGCSSWKFRGLQLIDFGRALDLSLYQNQHNQTFTGNNHVKEYQCVEMRNGESWSYQVDLYGACAIIHFLLHLSPMDVIKKKISKRCSGIPGIDSSEEYYLPKENFKRYWTYNWELLFIDLLHVQKTSNCLSLIEKHIQELQEFVKEQSKKIRVALSKEHQLMHEQGF